MFRVVVNRLLKGIMLGNEKYQRMGKFWLLIRLYSDTIADFGLLVFAFYQIYYLLFGIWIVMGCSIASTVGTIAWLKLLYLVLEVTFLQKLKLFSESHICYTLIIRGLVQKSFLLKVVLLQHLNTILKLVI